MTTEQAVGPSRRRDELVESAYGYVLTNGLTGISLRPLAEAIGSSTGVLRFLFGSKDGLTVALLARAREDELRLIDRLAASPADASLRTVGEEVWRWLRRPRHRALLALWMEAYAASLLASEGPFYGFAAATVTDWLTLFARWQPPAVRRTAAGEAERRLLLTVLRGALLDLLSTGDDDRTTRAVHRHLGTLNAG